MTMLEIIKKASINAVNSGNPMSLHYGEVISDDLDIKIDQKLVLDKDFFIIPETFTQHKETINGIEVIVSRELKTGDTVLLLRVQGGQEYLIIDKVV